MMIVSQLPSCGYLDATKGIATRPATCRNRGLPLAGPPGPYHTGGRGGTGKLRCQLPPGHRKYQGLPPGNARIKGTFSGPHRRPPCRPRDRVKKPNSLQLRPPPSHRTVASHACYHYTSSTLIGDGVGQLLPTPGRPCGRYPRDNPSCRGLRTTQA